MWIFFSELSQRFALPASSWITFGRNGLVLVLVAMILLLRFFPTGTKMVSINMFEGVQGTMDR